MLQRQIERTDPLTPSGISTAIESEAVDIFPVESVQSFTADRIEQPVPISMSLEDKRQYFDGLAGEIEFLKKHRGLELPSIEEIIGDTPDPARISPQLDTLHQYFVRNGLGNLGLRNISVNEDGSISADYCVVPHPAYRLFNEHENQNNREFGSNVGVATILTTSATSGEDSKLIIQHRSADNRVYGDVPGASIAGLASLPENLPDTIDVIEHMKEQLLEEGREEIGVSPENFVNLTLTSIQLDKRATHHELAFSIRTDKSIGAIMESALSNKQTDTAEAFKENFVALDATPEVIETLLSDMPSPFPNTHAGPLVMEYGNMLREQDMPETEVIAKLQRLAFAMDDNYRRIDELCGGKYTPGRPSTEQGLSSFPDLLAQMLEEGKISGYQFVKIN